MKTLTISDLIAELEDKLDSYGDIPVMTSSDYGDRCHTEQLNNIQSVEVCIPKKSGYSSSGLAFSEELEDPDECEESVLVLRYIP